MNGRTVIPEKDWRAERDGLLTERRGLVAEYHKLADDVKNVEALRRGAEHLMSGITPERANTRARDTQI